MLGSADARAAALERLCDQPTRSSALGATTARPVIRIVLPRLRQIRAVGGGHVPDGPVILAPNHIGFLDGLVVQHCAPRPVSFLVYDKAVTGVQGVLLRAGGAIPLPQDPSAGPALGRAVALLRRRRVVGMFPEGARGRGRLEEHYAGVAWLAQMTQAPVVPVAILGTRVTGQLAGAWPDKDQPIVVDLGRPLQVARPGGSGRPLRDAVMADLVPALQSHVEGAVQRHGIDLPEDIPPDLLPA